MIKKISLFFSAIAIAILGIFGGISLKNTAEPQYFLENIQVKKQFNNSVKTWENTNVIELTSPNLEYRIDECYELDDTNVSVNLEIYLTNTELYNQNKYVAKTPKIEDAYVYITLYGLSSSAWITISESSADEFIYDLTYNFELNKWLFIDEIEIDLIIFSTNVNFVSITGQNTTQGFYKMGCVGLNVQNLVVPTIKYDPTQEPEEPTPPLEQINTLVYDIVNWFTNIFKGLGDVFYDPTANKLTAWGTVLFIGVAIMLISMALKWVISLIQGV